MPKTQNKIEMYEQTRFQDNALEKDKEKDKKTFFLMSTDTKTV